MLEAGETMAPRRLMLTILAGIALCAARTRAVDWPIDSGGAFHALYSTYGQFYEFAGGLHFHEGVDILASPGTPVVARQSGQVLRVQNTGSSGDFMILATPASGPDGWNYVHLHAGSRPAGRNGPGDPGGAWQAGDLILIGDVLGFVADQSGHPDHLHIDLGSGPDTAHFGASTVIRRPVGDPLDAFAPSFGSPNPAPFVSDEFHYRIADHDRNGAMTRPPGSVGPTEIHRHDNLYFQSDLAGLRWLGRRAPTHNVDASLTGPGSADIDVIAMAHDLAQAGGVPNAPKRLRLRLTGLTFGDDTGDAAIFDFSGEFLEQHGYATLRDPDAATLRTVYENDQMSDSGDVSDLDPAVRGRYWFILTNTDGDMVVQAADRARSWHSDAAAGSIWHDPDAPDASHNTLAAFRDDRYLVAVTAIDHQGQSFTAAREVVLDNYDQSLRMAADRFGTGDRVEIAGGSQFVDGQNVNFHLLEAAPIEGQSLGQVVGRIVAGALGELPGFSLGMFARGEYFLVADYDGDGLYLSALDAAAAFSVVPEPGAAAMAGWAAVAMMRRLIPRRRVCGRRRASRGR
jgi:hypothetical protein